MTALVLFHYGLICFGCLPTFQTLAPAASFADSFERSNIGDGYRKDGGTWKIKDGALVSVGEHNIPLWSKHVLPKNVRIEFTSTSKTSAIDTKVEIFGDGIRHESGYIVIVGGWKNTRSVIARLNEHEHDRRNKASLAKLGKPVDKTTRFKKGETLRWKIERVDGKEITLSINEKPLLSYVDSEPLYGERNRYFAFTNWESDVAYDDLRITPLP